MDKDRFRKRLTELRLKLGVSARDMSLSLGQSSSYINNIENGVSMPSLNAFFMICEFLDISPRDFFDLDNHNPQTVNNLAKYAAKLPEEHLNIVVAVCRALNYESLYKKMPGIEKNNIVEKDEQ